jgi:hypothetical protein
MSGRSGRADRSRLELASQARHLLSSHGFHAIAVPVPRRAPSHAGTDGSRIVAVGFAAGARTPRSIPAGRSSHRKKTSVVMTLAAPLNYLLLLCFSIFDALSVASALPVPFFSGRRRRPVFSLGLPPRPSPCSLPASTAAIALPCLPGPKAPLASFEQTPPRPWAAGHTLPPTGLLIFGMACRILSRAHGR